MNTPSFLIGITLLFWGWQTEFWMFAIPMALILEGYRFINWRWNLSTEDFRKMSHLCTILLVVVLFYILIADRSVRFIFEFFQWLPAICFPLLAAQTYSTSNGIDLQALLFFKDRKLDKRQQQLSFDLTYPYFAVCILSASAANVRDSGFYIGLFILSSVVFWYWRSPRFPFALWLCLIVLAGGMGIAGHIGLHRLQIAIEKNTMHWVKNYYRHDVDPLRRTTAIGDIGSVKQSNKILFRVKAAPEQLPPKLLRRATYNKYVSTMWAATNSEFKPIESEADGESWNLRANSHNSSTVTVSQYLDRDTDLLKLPDGTFKVDNLPVEAMEQNHYGTVKVIGKPEFISYQAQFDPNLAVDSPPTEDDLLVPEAEQAAIAKLISEWELANKSPQEIINRVEGFFQRDFSYSLKLARRRSKITPLSAFLLDHRSGHCEYFATSATLLLRSLGIPARYAIGYSVREFSRLENQYIIRSRHAHAWTLIYVNHNWQVLDATPGSWGSIEDANAPDWNFIGDFWSWCGFKISQLLVRLKKISELAPVWWLLLPLLFILLRQLKFIKQISRSNSQNKSAANAEELVAGADSELYAIEQALAKVGLERLPEETFKRWIKRLPAQLPTADLIPDLEFILELHYRYRFDPQGIEPAEREKLKYYSQLWLEKYHKHCDYRDSVKTG